jgi:hypothetical protein
LQINISTTTKDDTMAAKMLEVLGFPFTKPKVAVENNKTEKTSKK